MGIPKNKISKKEDEALITISRVMTKMEDLIENLNIVIADVLERKREDYFKREKEHII